MCDCTDIVARLETMERVFTKAAKPALAENMADAIYEILSLRNRLDLMRDLRTL